MVNLVGGFFFLVQRRRRNRRRNPREQYQCGPWGGREAPEVRREKRKRGPYRIGSFPGGGYRREQCWGEKSCAARPEETGEPYARRIFWCGRTDRNRSDSNLWKCLPERLRIALAGDGDSADVAEAAQSVIIAGARGELNDFERAAEIHVEAALFGFAIQRGGAMNDGVGGVHERGIFIVREAEMSVGEVAAENADARIEESLETRKIQMELEGAPEAFVRFLLIARAHEQVQRIGMIREQIRRDVGTDVAGGPGQEDGHSV